MTNTKKRRRRARSTLTGLLCLAVLAPWLLCMGLLTAAVAQGEGNALAIRYGDQARQQAIQSSLPWGQVDGWGWSARYFLGASGLFDAMGNPLGGSWQDFLALEYLTQEEYETEVETSGRYARAILDRSCLTEGTQRDMESGYFDLNRKPLRLEGALEDAIFTPRTISFWSTGAQNPTWVQIYNDPTAIHPQAQTVTLYATRYHACCPPEHTPLTYRGTRYDSLSQLVETLGPDLLNADAPVQLWSWPNLLVGTAVSTDQGILVCGVWADMWPLVWERLWWVYLLTLGLCVLLIVELRRVLIRELLSPIQQLSQALDTRQKWLLLRPSQACRWQEGHNLQAQFQAHGAEYREQKDEIQRLNQALTYAKAAEEHRRTFTSHMAHELKTPLAVIHSYAQGLQEHIAEDKREKYLATICSEAERMNGMVLELLDLSRLEAGRVKLRRETFSLSQLTRSTLEKLAPSLEAKGLRLSTALEDPSPVLADRGRMAQVVENLLTNAVKYTPAGGNIQVEVAQTRRHTTLRVANDCPPIHDEELEQLFEPFYRRPDAAPGEGTGLGLAIVGHIMQLHGGRCEASATPSGVQFTVTL